MRLFYSAISALTVVAIYLHLIQLLLFVLSKLYACVHSFCIVAT